VPLEGLLYPPGAPVSGEEVAKEVVRLKQGSESQIEHRFIDPNIKRRRKVINEHVGVLEDNTAEPPFFSIIEFNLSGLCNRTCVFCPRVDPTIFPNTNEHISIDLYEKIMKDLSQIDYSGTLIYSGFGEPLLYKRIEAIIELSKRHCPGARLEITTDGDFVTPDKLRALFNAGLDLLLISMYDGPHQVGELERTISEASLMPNNVILRERWLPPEEHYGITLNNRSGMVEIPDAGISRPVEPLKRRCFYPFYQVLIDYDGSVLLCPHDWGKKMIVGNLNDKSLNDLWNNSLMKRVRLNLAREDRNFAPCKDCDVDGMLTGEKHFKQWMAHYNVQK